MEQNGLDGGTPAKSSGNQSQFR